MSEKLGSSPLRQASERQISSLRWAPGAAFWNPWKPDPPCLSGFLPYGLVMGRVSCVGSRQCCINMRANLENSAVATCLENVSFHSNPKERQCQRMFKTPYTFFFFVVNFVIHWNETATGLHVFPILIPHPTSLSTRSLWVFPVHQVRALVSCIQPGLVICFTLDSIQVSMLFSWIIPPSPSPTESKRLFYTSVSFFFLFCI